MPLLDDLLDIVMQPQVLTPALNMLSRRVSKDVPSAEERMIERIEQIQERLDEIAASRKGGRKKGKTTPAAPVDMTEVRDTVVQIAGALKEAARFARADGTDHPEARQRIEDALAQIRELPYLERYVLSPERVSMLPNEQRKVIESIQPALRRLRQVDRVQVSKVKGLEDAAGLAGTIAAQLQIATAVGGVAATDHGDNYDGSHDGNHDSSHDNNHNGKKPYSLYAPEMNVDTGCIECGRSHLSGTAKTLQLAARDAQTKGVDHPDVAARITFALEELDMLNKYDWLPEKISRNGPEEQRILNEYAPKVKELREKIGSARDPLTLARLAKQAQEIKESYLAQTDRLVKDQAVFALLAPTSSVAGRGTARVSRRAVEHYSLPTLQEIRTFSAPENVNQLMANIAKRLTERGVRVQTVPLAASEEMSTEGQYIPSTNTLELNGGLFGLEFLGAENPYALQVMIHEAAHALLHNSNCLTLPGGRITPEIERIAEDEAEGVTIATMLELGLPVIDREGQVIVPGQRMVEWDRVRELVDPQEFANVKWATEWIKRAAKGEDGGLIAESCPVSRTPRRTETMIDQGFVKGPGSTAVSMKPHFTMRSPISPNTVIEVDFIGPGTPDYGRPWKWRVYPEDHPELYVEGVGSTFDDAIAEADRVSSDIASGKPYRGFASRQPRQSRPKPPLYQGPPVNLHEEVEKAQQAARQAGYGSMREKFIVESGRELERLQGGRPSFQRTNFILTAIDHMGREGMSEATFTDADGTKFEVSDLGDHYSVTVNYGPQGTQWASGVEIINLPKETFRKIELRRKFTPPNAFHAKWFPVPISGDRYYVAWSLPGLTEQDAMRAIRDPYERGFVAGIGSMGPGDKGYNLDEAQALAKHMNNFSNLAIQKMEESFGGSLYNAQLTDLELTGLRGSEQAPFGAAEHQTEPDVFRHVVDLAPVHAGRVRLTDPRPGFKVRWMVEPIGYGEYGVVWYVPQLIDEKSAGVVARGRGLFRPDEYGTVVGIGAATSNYGEAKQFVEIKNQQAEQAMSKLAAGLSPLDLPMT